MSYYILTILDVLKDLSSSTSIWREKGRLSPCSEVVEEREEAVEEGNFAFLWVKGREE